MNFDNHMSVHFDEFHFHPDDAGPSLMSSILIAKSVPLMSVKLSTGMLVPF